jgi:hypothetical protein
MARRYEHLRCGQGSKLRLPQRRQAEPVDMPPPEALSMCNRGGRLVREAIGLEISSI